MLKKLEKKQRLNPAQPLSNEEHIQMQVTRSTTLDWQILREEESWDDLVARPDSVHSTVAVGSRMRGLRVIFSGLVIVFLICAGLYVWRTAEIGAQILESELAAEIAAEPMVPLVPYAALARPGLPAPAATIRVQDIVFQDNVAVVQVQTAYTEADGQSYTLRQRHFYRSSESGWVRVLPNSAYLGLHQTYNTEFFAFLYYEVDKAAVEAIAAEVDAIYAGLRQDYDLPTVKESLVIELVTDVPPAEGTCNHFYRICVQSPALMSLPDGVSEMEALRFRLLNLLVHQVRRQAANTDPPQYQWGYAAYMLTHVQMRRHSDLLSAWQRDMVRWLYSIKARSPRPDGARLARELEHLCNTHQIVARQMFFAESVPIEPCIAPSKFVFWNLAEYEPPRHLRQLHAPDLDTMLMASSAVWTHRLEFETLFDYMVASHGREVLPVLVEAFRHHETWETLIPAVFGISVGEFERGWQEYLHTLQRK